MRHRSLILIGCLALTPIALVATVGGIAPVTQPDSPIPLKDIHSRGVEGRLGLRLGTIVEVTGDVVPNTSQLKIDTGEPYFLKISSVNGSSLIEAIEYPFVKQNTWLDISPKVGDKFHFVGYETGGFDGSPDGEFEYVSAYATTNFSFHTHFVVLSAK